MKRTMRMMSLLMAIVMSVSLLSGCGGKKEEAPKAEAPKTEAPKAEAPKAEAPAEEELPELTFTLGTGGNDIEMSEQGVQKFCQLVNEKTDGKVTIDYVNNGQLGAALELAESMELGTLKMAKLDPTTMNGYVPEYSLLVQPFLIKDYEHMKKVVELPEVKALDARLAEEHNITILAWLGCGFRSIAAQSKIESVADCKGIVVRSPEADIYMNTFKTLGMSPTPLAFGEMYSALEAGVINACDGPASVIYQYELYKNAPFVWRSNHMFSPVILTVATDVWNELPAAYQEIFQEAAAEAAAWEWDSIEAEEDQHFQTLADSGATVTAVADYDGLYEELVELFTPGWQKTIDELGGDAAAIVEAIKACA